MRKIDVKSLIKSAVTVVGISVLFVLFPLMAEAAGKITVTSENGVNIRSGAGTNSVIIASGLKNDTYDVLGTETDSNGATWYKVQVDANTVGYIYGEFVTANGVTNDTPAPKPQETPATSTEVTEAVEVEPVVGSVTADVNVREGASTKHKIVSAAKTGSKVTVLGYFDTKDGQKWYQVSYTSNTAQVNGFIRSDFVKLDGELVDKVDEPEPEPEPEPIPEPEPQEPVKVYKDYEAVYDEAEDVWYLENYILGEKHKVNDLYDALDKVKAVENESKAAISKKNIVIGILTFVIVALLAGAVVVYIMFRRWYFGYDDTEEPVNVKKQEKPVSTKRTPVIDDDDDDDDDDVPTVRRTTSQVSAHTIAPAQPKPQATVMNKIPEGGVRLPDGRIQMPDGSIRRAVVGVKLPDGSIKLPDGRIRKPDGTMIMPETQAAPVQQKPAPVSLTTDDDDLEYGFLGMDNNLDED